MPDLRCSDTPQNSSAAVHVDSSQSRCQVVISIDLDSAHSRHVSDARQLLRTGEHLVDLFEQRELLATWGSSNPGQSCLTSRIRHARVGELALIGQDNWFSPASTARRLAQQLGRYVGLAESSGIHLRSMLCRELNTVRHCAALLKHGIVVMRSSAAHTKRNSHWLAPRQLRHGLWDVPALMQIPSGRGLLGRASNSRWLRRVLAVGWPNAQPLHLAIDVALLARCSAADQKQLHGILENLAHLAVEGRMQLVTMQQMVEQLTSSYPGSPQRSILRLAG